MPVLIAVSLVAVACGDDDAGGAATTTIAPVLTPSELPEGPVDAFGTAIPPAPEHPEGPLSESVVADLDVVFADPASFIDAEAIDRLGSSGDARVAWLLSDLLRFFQAGPIFDASVGSFESLTGTDVPGNFVWGVITDWLIAWDTPAPPGYARWKGQLFTAVEAAWEPFFTDPDSKLDYRWLSWGGVLIDDRPMDFVAFPCPQSCIPALNDPEVTDAAGGDWYPDESIVFGVIVDGEARAYPKNIMEVHEMVNDGLAGRRIGIPYCTLCGSAQAYFTDVVPAGFDPIELRTSGLLSRSNKVMFDFNTFSVFDTFTGEALTGPLREAGFTLEMTTVYTSTWGDWKTAHPDTTIVARDGGIGRSYSSNPLGNRDDDGPIFPVGDVDPRLPVQEQVLGVIAPDGTPIAFPADATTRALQEGRDVELLGVRVVTDGAGLTAETIDGDDLVTHQAFWFAWSQFHEDTLVWTGYE